MFVGQLIIGTFFSLGSGIYTYLVLDVPLWLAFAIYSGVGAGAVLFAMVSTLLLMRPDPLEIGPAGTVPELAPAG